MSFYYSSHSLFYQSFTPTGEVGYLLFPFTMSSECENFQAFFPCLKKTNCLSDSKYLSLKTSTLLTYSVQPPSVAFSFLFIWGNCPSHCYRDGLTLHSRSTKCLCFLMHFLLEGAFHYFNAHLDLNIKLSIIC